MIPREKCGSIVYMLTKTNPRLWTLEAGIAMVITDLHGDWDAYQRYRDRFIALQAHGLADYLVIMGDLIHHKHLPDHSVDMVLDVLRLQDIYGAAIIYLCGNHELPHIYHIANAHVPPFEHALSARACRAEVMHLFASLPFFIRTAAGVSLVHAGASQPMADTHHAQALFSWDHAAHLERADRLLAQANRAELRQSYAAMHAQESYAAMAHHYLAVRGPEDQRYDDLLRGWLASTTTTEGFLVWDALSTRCEETIGVDAYNHLVDAMLQHLAAGFVPQEWLIAGHMNVAGGYEVIGERHIRLASAKNAHPREAGLYMLFDTARPMQSIEDVCGKLHSVYVTLG